jgi:sugar phosphate isomerase/epimerase
MRLSVWSSYYFDLSPEDALREFKAHGFDHCEISFEHAYMLMERGDIKKAGEEFKRFAYELGVDISQGHLSYEAKLCKSEGREFLKKQIDLFLAMGVKNAVLHCDSLTWRNDEDVSTEEKIKENESALSELLDYIRDTDMIICLENLISTAFVNSVDGLLHFIEKFGSKNLGICLDTGHLNLTDRDQVNFIRKAGKHIKALHLADNEGKRDQHLMPYGCGSVDFVSVIREMKSLGYEGMYNLEIPGERMAPLEILGYKLDYIKKMMNYLDKITEG